MLTREKSRRREKKKFYKINEQYKCSQVNPLLSSSGVLISEYEFLNWDK